MKNDEDTKESEPLCRDGHFGSGFTISCFCSTYALQLYSVLWNNNSELSVIDFLPIKPVIILVLSIWYGCSHLIELGVHNLEIFEDYGNRGAFLVGCASWFILVAVGTALAWIIFGKEGAAILFFIVS